MWSYGLIAPYVFAEFDAPAPTPEDLHEGQVILRVMAGGICGSDLPFFAGKLRPHAQSPRPGDPTIAPLGNPLHEVVGEVVASRDAALPVGAIAVGWATENNGLSEFIVVDGADVVEYSTDLEPFAAVMLQPLACVLYAVDALAGIDGASVAVIGQGPIGVLFSHVLKSCGAGHVTGVDSVDRSDVATAFAVDEALCTTSDRWAALVASGDAPAPDIVVEAVGHQVSTLTDAVRALGDGGQIYYFGIPNDMVYPFPLHEFLRKRGRLLSGDTRQDARRDVLRRADEYVAKHPEIVEPFVSVRRPVKQATAAFATALTPRPGRLKVVVETPAAPA